MSGCRRFEDLVAWQKARALTKAIYQSTERFGDFTLARHMQRTAVSIMANIAEGFERNRSREFHQYLSTAKASCAELRSHLYVGLDSGKLGDGDFQALRTQAEEVGRIIGGLRAAVAKRGKPNSALSTQHSALKS